MKKYFYLLTLPFLLALKPILTDDKDGQINAINRNFTELDSKQKKAIYKDSNGDIISAGVLHFTSASNESTGAGSASLGANSPAITLTAPYKWLKIKLSDGSVGYIPIWK